MEIEVYNAPGVVYVIISGRIVLDDCDTFKTQIYPLLEQGAGQIAVDLEQADFIDSAGLGALVGMKTRAGKHNARLALVNPSPPIADILEVSKLITIFDVLTGLNAKTMRVTSVKPQYLVR